MASKTLTISVPEDLLAFLDENTALSASKVFQGALINIRDTFKSNPQLIEANKLNARLEKMNKKLNEELLHHADFLGARDLWEDFSKEYPE